MQSESDTIGVSHNHQHMLTREESGLSLIEQVPSEMGGHQMQNELRQMDEMVESNPVAVYGAIKDILFSQQKQSPFVPCKQKNTADYSLEEGDNPNNFAKYVKREAIDRKNHADEDLSFKVSPYKNRVTIADSYRSTLGYKALN